MLPARLNFPKLSRSSYPSRRNNKYSNSTNMDADTEWQNVSLDLSKAK